MLASVGGAILSRSLICANGLQVEIIASSFHTASTLESRIKWRSRHKPFWHTKKLSKAEDDPLTEENQTFIKQYIDKKYSGPLKEEFAPWARGKYEPGGVSKRPGVLAVKIGIQPLWLKNGKQIVTTMLHIQDNHVVKYTPRTAFEDSYMGSKKLIPKYTTVKPTDVNPNMVGFVTVGAVTTDPQKYTKDYCGLFSQCGLAPKRYLARFPVTENAVIQPGTPLTAAHFRPGQFVDVFGRTMERGFQGVMKRWGFHGMPATHGVTKSHRRGGTIGSGRQMSRVWPGKKMPGHVGGDMRWMRGLRIWRINYEENVLYVSGCAIMGKTGSVVQVCDTIAKAKKWDALTKEGEGLVDGPRYFPTAYPDDQEKVPSEEYWHTVHNFKEESLKL
eukprot:TRINITY_DN8719_c0_g1_i2.p1 TRINITY_DN8719_c0_g1~~TRINITY_DN8719_c0_g1_i2.p1  ORF type:complete len:388 (-),score=53.94 TRINITY_DN8719_c0_g1_i2:405-1568(-)